jgi:NitT/TauT family transport system permease protein
MLVATEMMGTSSGLGWFVVQSQESYHAARIFAGATIITALALALDAALKRIERKLIRWKPEFDERRVLIEDVVGNS